MFWLRLAWFEISASIKGLSTPGPEVPLSGCPDVGLREKGRSVKAVSHICQPNGVFL